MQVIGSMRRRRMVINVIRKILRDGGALHG